MRLITAKQKQVLDAIDLHTRKHGYPPSHKQLADALGLRSTSAVAMRLDALERKGFIKREYGVARSLRVVTT